MEARKDQLEKFKASYEKSISSICNYYDNQKTFLSNLYDELTKITPESITQDTINVAISQSEIKSVSLNEQIAIYSLMINENDIEEEK